MISFSRDPTCDGTPLHVLVKQRSSEASKELLLEH